MSREGRQPKTRAYFSFDLIPRGAHLNVTVAAATLGMTLALFLLVLMTSYAAPPRRELVVYVGLSLVLAMLTGVVLEK
jgi:hypothetical protein